MLPLDTIEGIATITAGETLQDSRDLDPIIQHLGFKLDRIREIISKFPDDTKPDSWKYQYWKTIEARVLKKWQMMDLTRRSGLRTNYRERKKIDYEWWEPHDGIGQSNNPLWDWSLPNRLDWSWENARKEFIQKARRGLA